MLSDQYVLRADRIAFGPLPARPEIWQRSVKRMSKPTHSNELRVQAQIVERSAHATANLKPSLSHIRRARESGHREVATTCLLRARSGHCLLDRCERLCALLLSPGSRSW